ncbi:MAG: hypothetical protein B7Z66_12150 [Chromatiales bacterium 21-64-14]|nr:MAG: hypothetical protein B7Z66_12150 [Chromatiales bacterium 21-64-14]
MQNPIVDFVQAAQRIRERRRQARAQRLLARLAALPPARREPYRKLLEAVFAEPGKPKPQTDRP